MYRRNRGSTILIIIIAIAALLLSVMGATFAFFTANIDYVDRPKEVVTKSQVLEIMFKQKNQIVYKNLMPGRPGIESQAFNQNRNSVKFTVQSTENVTLKTPYTVYFHITENTFGASRGDNANTNVVYLLNGVPGTCPETYCPVDMGNVLDSSIVNYCEEQGLDYKCGTGQYYDDTNFNSILHTFDKDTQATKLGRIPTVTGGNAKIKIGTGVVGAHGAIDEWEFEIWVNEVGDEQNYDQGKIIRGYIEIDTDETGKYSNEPSQFETP